MNLFRNQNISEITTTQLKPDEPAESIYNHNHNHNHNRNLQSIQKIKLSYFEEPMEGKAETDIAPAGIGRISFQGSFWRARSDSTEPITKGQTVLVTGRQNTTLLIATTEKVERTEVLTLLA